MVSLEAVLHWQPGEGRSSVHTGPSSISIRAGFTIAISHSVVMLLQGKSLSGEGGEVKNVSYIHTLTNTAFSHKNTINYVYIYIIYMNKLYSAQLYTYC